MARIRAFLFHPWTDLALGGVLVTSGFAEILREAEDVLKPGAHHGVAVYGLVLFFKRCSDLVEGFRKAGAGLESPAAGSADAGGDA